MHRKNWKGYLGLTTEEAFDRLFAELGSTLDDYRAEHGWHWKQILVSSFSPNSHYAILSLCSIAALLIEFLIIIVSYFSTTNTNQAWQSLLPEAFTLLFIAIGNSALQIWDNYKRVNELPVKIEKSLVVLKKLVQNVDWEEKNYPDLYMPFSPCITLQWCYRDRRLVNLPWSFLVPGDLIVLQPAQKIITKCQLIDAKETILESGTYYLPQNSQPAGPPPKLHDSLPSQKAIVIDSPYVAAINHYLKNMKNQPSTFYNKERFGVVNHLIERIILPTSMMIFICLCLVRFFYLPLWLGIRVSALSELILLQPMTYTLPFIPVGLPLIWYFLHAIGNAKIHMLFQLVKESEFDCSELFDLRIRRVWEEAAGFFMDKEETLHRSQGLLHILASVTALCCVDKKGILSWPNPLADKLFFLHSKPDKTIEPEVLDITHDNSNAFELHFDDPNWQSHLNSLKPLGLNILLNTCNWETMPTYSDFHSYISQEFFSNPNDDLLVPVMGRRCLCEVARIIGFEDRATCCFQLDEELCSFRHIESDEISRGKLTKAKIKFPFPHMMSVVVKERPGMNIQLMAQGTGDLVLDVCEDFWDGQDLKVLTDAERKHILDFYQRTALTSICTAFSYKPLFTKVGRNLASQYTELAPSKGLHFLPYFNHQGTTVSTGCLVSSILDDNKNTAEADDVEGSVELQNGQIFLGMVTMQYQACMDMVQLIEQLDSACIRFVHFSKENELRSRVFSEKMGLESGWNCHISLSNRSNPDDETEDSGNEDLLGLTGINFGSFHVGVSRTSARLNELRRGSSASVPELVTLNPNAELTEEQVEADRMNSDRIVRFAESCCKLERRHMSVTPTDAGGGGEAYDLVGVPNTPLGFDMSNTAKLPRGIEQVRPHLENVDNVPLLVSLFTDCTAETTTEMVHVMQDYGEVTIVMGSVANVENKRVFSRADACFGVEPLYPQACQKQQVYEPTYSGPTDVAMLMTSMPCSLYFRRNEQLAFYPLIGQARHYMNNCVRNVFQFWCCCQVTMVIFGLVATFVLIPPVYTIGDSIWIVTIIIPAMSLGLAFSVMDRVETDVMSRASWKNHWVLDRQLVMYTFWFYGMKFIPSMLNVILMAVFNLTWICEHMHNSTCSWVYPVPKVNGTAISLPCPNNWGCENSPKLLFVQQFSLFFLVLYFVVISSGFVYRSKYLWSRSPVRNREWVLSSIIIIFIQFMYMLAKLGAVSHFALVSPLVYVWGFAWTIFALALNELLRRQEMKINIRYQKRARLDFGTKLGMNSPF